SGRLFQARVGNGSRGAVVHICSFCGVTLPADATYCPPCGQSVAPTTITSAPQGPGVGGGATATFPPPSPGVGARGADDYGVYALIRRDQSPLAQETLQLLDATRTSVHPRLSAYLGNMLHSTLPFLVLAVLAPAGASPLQAQIPWPYLPLLLVVPVVITLTKLIEVKTTTITFEAGRLLITKGVFGRQSHNIELYRVLDIVLER